ncbi:hypothetical protein R4Z09_02365 [Niallia oryzisoli]|uniref:Core-binding (CB) domain-containing protein n=1 Tax=Niallia oryzisoli TaxID=1737571 RepID=A0ABZ2CDP3_9BACI
MLLKFTYQDFLEDRRFKNTTKTNIKKYEILLGKFMDYCIENEIVNVEDTNYSGIRKIATNRFTPMVQKMNG